MMQQNVVNGSLKPASKDLKGAARIALVPLGGLAGCIVLAALFLLTPFGAFFLLIAATSYPGGITFNPSLMIASYLIVGPGAFLIGLLLYRSGKYLGSLIASLSTLVLYIPLAAVTINTHFLGL